MGENEYPRKFKSHPLSAKSDCIPCCFMTGNHLVVSKGKRQEPRNLIWNIVKQELMDSESKDTP